MKIITGATLIDGTGKPPRTDSAVLVTDDGRIEAVGHREALATPENTEEIDATGMTLLPGLIDCHDHLSSFTYDLIGRWGLAEAQSLRHLRIAKVMEETLLTGYTTIRDCGWLDVGFKQAVEQGLIAGPRLLVATTPLSPTHGMADRSSPSGHHQPPSPDPNLPVGIADGVDQVRAKVREVVRVGADLVKVFQTGWARPHHGSLDVAFNRDELAALVSESHIHGRKVASHAVGGPGLRMSIEAGVDSIEHGSYLNEDPDLLRMMADKGIFFVPTFVVFIFHREVGTPEAQAEATSPTLCPITIRGSTPQASSIRVSPAWRAKIIGCTTAVFSVEVSSLRKASRRDQPRCFTKWGSASSTKLLKVGSSRSVRPMACH